MPRNCGIKNRMSQVLVFAPLGHGTTAMGAEAEMDITFTSRILEGSRSLPNGLPRRTVKKGPLAEVSVWPRAARLTPNLTDVDPKSGAAEVPPKAAIVQNIHGRINSPSSKADIISIEIGGGPRGRRGERDDNGNRQL